MSLIGSIISDFATPLTVYRRGEGWRRRADFFPGPLSVVPGVVATVYPARGDELMQLPEGERAEAAVWVISQHELRTSREPDIEADIVLFHDQYYKVIKSQPWDLGGFYKVMALRMNQSSTEKPLYFGTGLVSDSGVEFIRSLMMNVQAKRELYFETAIVDAETERVFIAMRPALGTPKFHVDDIESAFAQVESTSVDGDILSVYMSPTLTEGMRKVQVS